MDERRLDTGDVLNAGILKLPMPETEIPRGRENLWVEIEKLPPESELLKAIEGGKLIECLEYYGHAFAWKDAERYRGTLVQYRAISENPTFETASELVKWFMELLPQIAG